MEQMSMQIGQVTIQYGVIFSYGLQMTIVFLIALGLYTIRVLASRVNTLAWYIENLWRIGVSLVLFWLISAGIVLVPNIATLLGSIGFNAEQSPAAIAIVIAGYLLKNTSEVATANPGSIEGGE